MIDINKEVRLFWENQDFTIVDYHNLQWWVYSKDSNNYHKNGIIIAMRINNIIKYRDIKKLSSVRWISEKEILSCIKLLMFL